MVKRKDNDKSQGIKSKAMKKVDDKSKKKKTITKKKSSKKNYSQQEQLEVKGKSVFQIVADNNDENEDIQNDQNNEQLVGEQYNLSEQEQYDPNEQRDIDVGEIDQQYQNEDENINEGVQDEFVKGGDDAAEINNENNGQDFDTDQQQQAAIDEAVQGPVDISVLNLQIQQTLAILMNVGKLGQGLPRKHYLQLLKDLVHKYYGYNLQLIDHFLGFFNPTEMIQFFEANQTQRPLTIRTNTIKTRRKDLAQMLIQRGVHLDPLAQWSKVGIKIYESKVPIGATPEYLAGHYMLQSASSFLPVIALDPQLGERVLDLAAAPGGKTTYIAQLMKNTGCIFANDFKKQRLKALQYNLSRLGITNTAVTCRDGRKYSQLFPGSFDRVLLDAPCTGLGIISKDASIKANRLLIDIYKNSHLQKELLLAAIDCAKVGAIIVYSTCSVSPLENQEVVNYGLRKRFVKVDECGIEIGEEGLTKFGEKRFHIDLRRTRRIYPHVHNLDGFYVARLVKTAKGKRKVVEQGQSIGQ